jgi:hypothetical protein
LTLTYAVSWTPGPHTSSRSKKDATAAFDHEGMHAAHEVNGPRFAHAILTTEELLALLP